MKLKYGFQRVKITHRTQSVTQVKKHNTHRLLSKALWARAFEQPSTFSPRPTMVWSHIQPKTQGTMAVPFSTLHFWFEPWCHLLCQGFPWNLKAGPKWKVMAVKLHSTTRSCPPQDFPLLHKPLYNSQMAAV